MSSSTVSPSSFYYSNKDNAQNPDLFYTVKDVKHNVFDLFDKDGNGMIDYSEAQEAKLTNGNNKKLTFFNTEDRNTGTFISENEYNKFDVDKSSLGIDQYELAAACLYFDSKDGEKDGAIKVSSYNKEFDRDELKNIHKGITDWKTGYDEASQKKLDEALDFLRNNSDSIPDDMKNNLSQELDTLKNDQAIKVNDIYNPGEAFFTSLYTDDDAIEIGDMYGKQSNFRAMTFPPSLRTDNTIIQVNRENAYGFSTEELAATALHELTHYDQFDIRKDENYTIEDEKEAWYNKYEFLRNLEAKGNPVTLSQPAVFENYKTFYNEAQSLPEDQRKEYIMNKLQEKYLNATYKDNGLKKS